MQGPVTELTDIQSWEGILPFPQTKKKNQPVFGKRDFIVKPGAVLKLTSGLKHGSGL